eukprot:1065411-Rhodomonas_salina.1
MPGGPLLSATRRGPPLPGEPVGAGRRRLSAGLLVPAADLRHAGGRVRRVPARVILSRRGPTAMPDELRT